MSSLTDSGDLARVQSAAASTISDLHRRTAERIRVDAPVLERWIDRPILVLARIRFLSKTENAKAIHRLRNRLQTALQGRTLQVSWIHGDYWLGNLFLAEDQVTPTGIIDWDRAAPGELPWHDLFHLLLYTRRFVSGSGVSEILALLTGTHLWNRDEHEILAHARAMLPDDGMDENVMVLLYWLRHTAATLTLYPHYGADPEYFAANVEPIFRHLSQGWTG